MQNASEAGEPIKVYRRSWCEDSDAAVEYFQQNDIPYTEIDIEIDEEANEGVKFLTGGGPVTPTLVYRMHSIVFDYWNPDRFEQWWRLTSQDSAE